MYKVDLCIWTRRTSIIIHYSSPKNPFSLRDRVSWNIYQVTTLLTKFLWKKSFFNIIWNPQFQQLNPCTITEIQV